MLYTHVGKFMIGYMFTNQRLSKDFILFLYQNLGANFRAPKSGYRSQKRLVLPPALDLYVVILVFFTLCYYYYI